MKLSTLFLSAILFLLSVQSVPVFANSASENLSTGSKHSVLATSYGVKGSAQVASAVVAVPLVIAGSTAVVSMAAGEALLKNAVNSPNSKECEELEISDKIITADPSPAKAMSDTI